MGVGGLKFNQEIRVSKSLAGGISYDFNPSFDCSLLF